MAVGAGVASLTLTTEGATGPADARPVVSTHSRTDQHRTSLRPVGRERNGAAVYNYKYEKMLKVHLHWTKANVKVNFSLITV